MFNSQQGVSKLLMVFVILDTFPQLFEKIIFDNLKGADDYHFLFDGIKIELMLELACCKTSFNFADKNNQINKIEDFSGLSVICVFQ